MLANPAKALAGRGTRAGAPSRGWGWVAERARVCTRRTWAPVAKRQPWHFWKPHSGDTSAGVSVVYVPGFPFPLLNCPHGPALAKACCSSFVRLSLRTLCARLSHSPATLGVMISGICRALCPRLSNKRWLPSMARDPVLLLSHLFFFFPDG